MATFHRFHFVTACAAAFTLAAVVVHADNGMDMAMDGAMNLSSSAMRAYLHFSPGDTLWFLGWVPQTGGATAGACIGLFLLALVDRWLAAIRATADSAWRERAQVVMNRRMDKAKGRKDNLKRANVQLRSVTTMRTVPPFIASHDVARGVLHAMQAALGFAFMLAVMTFNAAFIIVIVVGLGVGEMLFGRYIGAANAHQH